MSIKLAGIVCLSLAISPATHAQTIVHPSSHAPADRRIADSGAFEAGITQTTARAAFVPQAPLTRPELWGLFLLMSVPRESLAHNSNQGAKP